jgi:primosomal replication protein N
MFSKEYLSKHGIGQSSTLKQAKNQKTMVSTRDSAGRSILKHDQRKQRSTLKQAKIQKTTPSAINTAGRSIFEHDQRKQRSTLRQAKNQKTIMSTIDTAVRSILNHDQRKQQSLTAGSSIQVAGSAQMLHKKQDHMTGFQTCFSNHCLSIIIIAPFITTIFICEAPVMLLAATFLL